MKQYRLLRSNKESGPYTAAELIEMGLKPYDLVWLDGRSAAWRYPCEMEEFKAHAPIVEEQPFDRFFKKAPAQKTMQPVAVAASAAPASNIATATKPRIRVKADWNRVEQPATAAVATKQVAVTEAVAPSSTTGSRNAASWQTSWLDWNEEQKAVGQASKTSHDKPQAKEAPPEVQQPLLETKFSQSLDSLKQRYAETILKAKNATTFGWGKYKTVASIALIAVIVLAAGIWVGNNWHSKSNTAALPLTATVQPVNPPSVTAQANDENTQTAASKSPAYSKEVVPDLNAEPVQQPAHASLNTGVKKYSKPHPSAATPKNAFVKTPAAVQPAKVTAVARPAFTQPADGGPGTRNKTVNPVVRAKAENNQPSNAATVAYKPAKDAGAEPKETAIYTHLSKQAKTDDYVNVETYQPNSQTLENYTLSVNNISDDMVDLVVLDIQYFNAAGKYKSGQTFSVKNIPVNQAATVKLPFVPSAASVKYKVSLVSIDKKGVYIIGE
jgi:hypothetical protein